MLVCHAGGCWSWLTAVRAALVPVSGFFAKWAYYLQWWSPVEGPAVAPGGRFGSAAMRQALNGGDRYRPPTGILPPRQRALEVCSLEHYDNKGLYFPLLSICGGCCTHNATGIRQRFRGKDIAPVSTLELEKNYISHYLCCLIIWLRWVFARFRRSHRLHILSIFHLTSWGQWCILYVAPQYNCPLENYLYKVTASSTETAILNRKIQSSINCLFFWI